jgi:hypothetical protein
MLSDALRAISNEATNPTAPTIQGLLGVRKRFADYRRQRRR